MILNVQEEDIDGVFPGCDPAVYRKKRLVPGTDRAHIALALTAILLAGVLGLLLGIWISECPRASGPVLTKANILYTIPSISLLGMLIPVMGIGNPTAVVALTLYG